MFTLFASSWLLLLVATQQFFWDVFAGKQWTDYRTWTTPRNSPTALVAWWLEHLLGKGQGCRSRHFEENANINSIQVSYYNIFDYVDNLVSISKIRTLPRHRLWDMVNRQPQETIRHNKESLWLMNIMSYLNSILLEQSGYASQAVCPKNR